MKKILLTMIALMAMTFSANADEPTYTAVGNTTTPYIYTYEGTEYSYSTNNASAPSLSNLSVEVYEGSNTIIVRGWWGVENYDLAVTLTSDGSMESIYPIVNGKSNPYVSGGYSYVDTGEDNVLAYIYNAYSLYQTSGSAAYLIFGLYYGQNWGYYVINWTIPNVSNINSVTARAENGNAPMYNLAGQRVSKNAKGLVIKNGKKMILR